MKKEYVPLLLITLGIPQIASANVIIPNMVALPISTAFWSGVIAFIEAIFAYFILNKEAKKPIAYWRLFFIVLLANITSSGLGFLAGILIANLIADLDLILVVGIAFILSILSEAIVIYSLLRKKIKDAFQTIIKTSVIMNIVSYFLIILFLLEDILKSIS